MRLVKNLLLVLFIALFSNLNAQDIHFSQFYCSPLTLNPAMTGAFNGTIRIGGIYRDQWASVIANPFRTPSFYVDSPIIKGFRKNDWIGVGGMLYSDKAGSGDLSNNSAMLSVAYHLAMDRKGKSILTFGLQGGMSQRKIDLQSQDLMFEDELSLGGGLGVGNSLDRSRAAENNSFFDLNAGAMVTSQVNKQTKINVGIAFRHIIKPEYNLITQSIPQDSLGLPLRFTLHGKFDFQLNKKWGLSPRFLFNSLSAAKEAALQVMAGYTFTEELDLNFGLGYRIADAGEILLGVDYKDFHVGLAYDLNTSPLNEVSNYNGGFEVCASWIGKIFKTPQPKPVILCPRF